MNKSLLSISIFLSLYCTAVKADPMQTIYNDMYSISKPNASKHGNGRYGVNLGGFSYRPNVKPNVKVLSARPPRLSTGGCGEIDFFAGSFSLLSSAELTQMGRAIMQGAQAYAFDIALASLSPMAAGIKKDLQKLMDVANKFSIDGCKQGRQWAKEAATLLNDGNDPLEEIKTKNADITKARSEKGLITDYFSGVFGAEKQNNVGKAAQEAGVKVEGNIAAQIFDTTADHGIFFNGMKSLGLEADDVLATLIGTTITSNQAAVCTPVAGTNEDMCSKPLLAAGKDLFSNFYFDLTDITNESDYVFEAFKCRNRPDCTMVDKVSGLRAKRLYPLIYKSLLSGWGKIAKGQPLTDEETTFHYIVGNVTQNVMREYGESLKESWCSLAALEITNDIMKSTAIQISDEAKKGIQAARARGEELAPGEKLLKANLESFLAGVEETHQILEQQIKTRQERFAFMRLLHGRRS